MAPAPNMGGGGRKRRMRIMRRMIIIQMGFIEITLKKNGGERMGAPR